jgi:hypothetical protein
MDAPISTDRMTVYRALDGGIHHARCGERLMLEGRHADGLDFYCLACAQSLPLSRRVLMRIPVAIDGEDSGVAESGIAHPPVQGFARLLLEAAASSVGAGSQERASLA